MPRIFNRAHRTVAILFAFFALCSAPALQAQQGVLFVESNKVGVGTATPAETLHVRGTTGNAKLLVEEASTTEGERILYQLLNNGVTIFQLRDTSPDGSLWNFEAEGPSFRFNKAGSGGEEMILRSRLDGSGFATLTVNGSIQATNLTFTSSRDAKTEFSAVDTQNVLKQVAGLPILEWSFREEMNGRRHIGPIAEEFNAAFGIEGSQREISLIDASGIALASVQGLYHLVQEKDATIRDLQSENSDLAKRVERLESLVENLIENR